MSGWLNLSSTYASGIVASELSPSCPQIEGSELSVTPVTEDCLTATIYSPLGARNLPILFW